MQRKLWLPGMLGFASPGMAAAGVPAMASAGEPFHGEDCCCCTSCCEESTRPPQLELDTTGIVPNTLLGCAGGCSVFEGVFLLDFFSPTASLCKWRYCDETTCSGNTTPYGWDVRIESTGLVCQVVANAFLGIACNDFTTGYGGGNNANYTLDFPDDPDDCCTELATAVTLTPNPATGITASIPNVGAPGDGGCDLLNFTSHAITVQAIGCP
jgi:hypothetical protein